MNEGARAIGLLPYVPPMLLVDEVEEFDASHIVVNKMFQVTDVLVTTHLVGRRERIVPGVLLVEMVGQAALLHQMLRGLCAQESQSAKAGASGVLGRCKATFHRPAHAGRKLLANVSVGGSALGAVLYLGRVSSDGANIANIEILAKIDGGP